MEIRKEVGENKDMEVETGDGETPHELWPPVPPQQPAAAAVHGGTSSLAIPSPCPAAPQKRKVESSRGSQDNKRGLGRLVVKLNYESCSSH